MLEVKEAVCGYARKGRKKTVLQNLSFAVGHGEVLCVLGLNGVGKTTLFKALRGGAELLAGEVRVDGKTVADMSKREIARKIGFVPQYHVPPFPYTVRQIVVMGRLSHLPLFAGPAAKDELLAQDALETLGIGRLAEEIYSELSGGERQLVLVARALAQQAGFLMMDEPTSNLDLRNQTLVVRNILSLAAAGIGILFTTHDPNQAFLCASRVMVLQSPEAYQYGRTGEILTQAALEELYGVSVSLIKAKNKNGKEGIALVSHI